MFEINNRHDGLHSLKNLIITATFILPFEKNIDHECLKTST